MCRGYVCLCVSMCVVWIYFNLLCIYFTEIKPLEFALVLGILVIFIFFKYLSL